MKENSIIETPAELFLKITSYLKQYNQKAQKNIRILENQLKKEQENFTKLSNVGQAIGKALNFDELLCLMLDQVIEVTKAERGFLMLLQENRELDFQIARDDNKNYLSAEEFVISHSIPYQVLDSGKATFIANTEQELQLSKSIIELKLKSIICAPLRVKKEIIGVIYIDNRIITQEFTNSDLHLFEAISDLAAVAIERARLYEGLREKERIDKELQIAANIQKSLLPAKTPDIIGLRMYGKTKSAKEMGGDYYDFIYPNRPDELYIAIGDVSGKGVPAGLVTIMVKATLQLLVNFHKSTQKILREINQIIIQNTPKNTDDTRFMTFLLLYWDVKQEKLYYTGAGHEHLIILRKEGELEIIRTGGIALGITDEEDILDKLLKEKQLYLNNGDTLILYTDGITEARDFTLNLLGLEFWCELIKKCYDVKPQIMLNELFDKLNEYMGDTEQYDDMTLLIIRRD